MNYKSNAQIHSNPKELYVQGSRTVAERQEGSRRSELEQDEDEGGSVDKISTGREGLRV